MDTDKRLDAVRPYVLSLFRMVVALLFASHGASTVLGTFGGPDGGQPAVGHWPSWWAGLIQLVCGVLVFAGVGEAGTRVAALLGSGSMAYAYFTVHQKHALWPIENGGEASVMFCWSLLLITVAGPGAWSLAHVARRVLRAPAGASPDPEPELT
ncbi:DoxX family protein [Actinacidiphila bryophytorum]|uniref:DoxX family protein n=1 Tax=Actinacidiphila bryophytorum TaxID=1436133 RepID=UPI00217697B2|nr:DoxX family protein [Actinacidiphila bryophytorum]UWE07503.1 DoxX family protein [Actinacidiphila bryophytorum]